MSVGDEEEVLVDGLGGAPADVERRVQARHHHAGLVAAHGDSLD